MVATFKDLCRMMLARRGRRPKLRFCLKIGILCYMFLSFRKKRQTIIWTGKEHVEDFQKPSSEARGIVNPVSKEISRLEAQLARMDEHIINLTSSLVAAKASVEALQFQKAIKLGEEALTASFRS